MKHNAYQENYNKHISPMRLTCSASDQNVFFTYVCLINEVKHLTGNDNDVEPMNQNRSFHSADADDLLQDQPIQVERSKALHELVESHKTLQHEVVRKPNTIHFEEDIETESDDADQFESPNKLKLTKMKWLTEGRDEYVDSSSPSISPVNSSTSTCSRESDDVIDSKLSFGEKCLSTILKLDREHNMFGLSNIAIVGKKTSKKIRKEDRPVFPQTAIIQRCCVKGCCKHKSNTDLPSSLKCGVCSGHCVDPCCPICAGPCGLTCRSPFRKPCWSRCGSPCESPCGPPCGTPCGSPCEHPPCPSLCTKCPRGNCICKNPCSPSKCRVDCTNCYGLKVSFKRKPTFEPSPNELTPRSSCILQKPMAARSCHHFPQCIPPSSCFPYLMPCYWPSRAGAPCNHPSRCFHNPPCRAPRTRKIPIPPEELCPKNEKCEDEKGEKKCPNQNCPGSSRAASLETISNEKKKKKQKKRHTSVCECDSPTCSSCFVRRPRANSVKSIN